jgi:integrase
VVDGTAQWRHTLLPIMASIQQRVASGGGISYRVQVRVQGFPPQTATFTRKTDARAWAQQTESAIREGRYFTTNEARKHTVADAIDRYLEWLERNQSASLPKQRSILGWWRQRIGAYSLAHATPAVLSKERDALLAENIGSEDEPEFRTQATGNRHIAAISKVFSVAVKEWHWMRDNPALRVQKGQEAPGRVRYLSADERKQLLDACRASPFPSLGLIVLLALSTGMRRGELKALRWPDVDFNRGVIVLHKTKNRERRAVPISSAVRPLLQEHGRVRRLDTDLVFLAPGSDKPLDFDHAFIDAVRAAGIEDFRFHDLRHTAASYLAMSGATTAEIAAVLGHKTLAMVKRYAHLSEQHATAVVQRMTTKFLEG